MPASLDSRQIQRILALCRPQQPAGEKCRLTPKGGESTPRARVAPHGCPFRHPVVEIDVGRWPPVVRAGVLQNEIDTAVTVVDELAGAAIEADGEPVRLPYGTTIDQAEVSPDSKLSWKMSDPIASTRMRLIASPNRDASASM